MKKYTNNTLLLIVVSLIIATVLNFLLGAIPGFSSEKTVAQANSSPVQEITPAKSIQTPTPRAVPKEDYQDAQWTANVQKHSALLSEDIKAVGNTTSNLDSDKLATYGQYLIDDTQAAVEENNQYMVSPKCQDTQNEWELALKDYSSAGELMIKASEEAGSNNTDGNDVEQASSLIDSGSGHLNSVKEFLKTSA